jgi:hypothetical protein
MHLRNSCCDRSRLKGHFVGLNQPENELECCAWLELDRSQKKAYSWTYRATRDVGGSYGGTTGLAGRIVGGLIARRQARVDALDRSGVSPKLGPDSCQDACLPRYETPGSDVSPSPGRSLS